jgi:hypothetical protein
VTFVPSQSIKEFIITYPIFTIMLVISAVIALSIIVRVYMDYPTMALQIDITKICIGGACP